jgi:hypothetical protein
MLREDIKRLIDAAPNSEEGAKYICQHLENELEMHENDWFGDDPLLASYFSETDDPAIEAASDDLCRRVEQILTP